MTINDRAIATIKCPICEQPAGQRCVAPTGRPVTYAHSTRQFAAIDQKTEEE
ncbi:hypothetical protein GTY67_13450 [Streptomyces sp. SID8374]|uniref:zinc finger domain-containing protein n=1 Tax=Streptomyces sp. SID8374 TaxID=2690354 RepID=UPI00136F42D2|nr:hypothetical protein [Streptomyces sp. SID8374]MYX14402.1 hypothetical protein [Streptomyces sp. SID8374]